MIALSDSLFYYFCDIYGEWMQWVFGQTHASGQGCVQCAQVSSCLLTEEGRSDWKQLVRVETHTEINPHKILFH